MKYPKTLIEAKELLASHTYDLGWNKQPDSMKSVNQGQSENQKETKKKPKRVTEQSKFLAYHLRKWKIGAMHVGSQATQALNVSTSPRFQKNSGLST